MPKRKKLPGGRQQLESFLRNHQEDIGVMQAVAIRHERAGEIEEAERIRRIVAAWEFIREIIELRLENIP